MYYFIIPNEDYTKENIIYSNYKYLENQFDSIYHVRKSKTIFVPSKY